MPRLKDVLLQAKEQIEIRDAEIIAQKIFGISEVEIITKSDKIFSDELQDIFLKSIDLRASGKSISEIFGIKNFWKHEFIVSNDVLTPRPETEFLVEWALENHHNAEKIIDIGTGSGCIISSIAQELSAQFYFAPGKKFFLGVDISEKALEIAKKNIEKLGVENMVELRKSNLLESITAKEIKDSLIVTNLPYIPDRDKKTMDKEVIGGDPGLALFSGESGTDLYEELFTSIPDTFFALGFEYDPPQTEFFKELLEKKFPKRSINFFHDLAREIRFGIVK